LCAVFRTRKTAADAGVFHFLNRAPPHLFRYPGCGKKENKKHPIFMKPKPPFSNRDGRLFLSTGKPARVEYDISAGKRCRSFPVCPGTKAAWRISAFGGLGVVSFADQPPLGVGPRGYLIARARASEATGFGGWVTGYWGAVRSLMARCIVLLSRNENEKRGGFFCRCSASRLRAFAAGCGGEMSDFAS